MKNEKNGTVTRYRSFSRTDHLSVSIAVLEVSFFHDWHQPLGPPPTYLDARVLAMLYRRAVPESLMRPYRGLP